MAIPSEAQESNCKEKEQLLYAYRHALGDYHRAFAVLNLKLDTLPNDMYKRLRTFLESARLKSEEAAAALRRHTREHGC